MVKELNQKEMEKIVGKENKIFESYSYIYSQNDICVGTTWIEVLVYI